jgi:outer membrane protein assembly factor BamB
MVKNGGLVTCLDAASGALVYEGRLDQRGPCYGSPVAGDGKLYCASARGQVTVFAAGDELEVLARNDLGERILATPALVAGAVYVRTAGHLYAFADTR